jgi:hypothetical protein
VVNSHLAQRGAFIRGRSFPFTREVPYSGRLPFPWGIRPDSFNISTDLEGQIMAYDFAFRMAHKLGKSVFVVDDTFVTTIRPTSGQYMEVTP